MNANECTGEKKTTRKVSDLNKMSNLLKPSIVLFYLATDL